MPSYVVYACDPYGNRIADISNFTRLQYTRIVNDWSTATVTLPPGFDTSLLRIPDGRLEIWRNGKLVTNTVWLMQVLRPKRDASGNVTIELEADTPLGVLREPGRYADQHYNTAFTDINAPACTALINCWRYNAGDLAGNPFSGVTRRLDILLDSSASIAGAGISTDYSLIGQGPTIQRTVENRSVLELMRDIANDATQQGTYVAFDIVATLPTALQFQVFLNQRGVDRRALGGTAPVILSPDFGTLGETTLEINYRDEVTVAYAYGKGEEPYRPVVYDYDSKRLYASPFRYRELMVDYNQSGDYTMLNSVARAATRAGRPLIVLTGKILSTPGCEYGVHWDWGDFVTISDFGFTLDARIDAMTVTVDDTTSGPFETVEANVRSETYL